MNENSSTPSVGSATSSKTGPEPRPAPVAGWSLAARLTAWYTGSAFILILAAVIFLYWALVSTLEREDDQFLADRARVLLEIVRETPDNERELKQEIDRESVPQPTGQLFLRALDVQGRPVAETAGMAERLPPERFPPASEPEFAADRATELTVPAGQSYRVVAIRVPEPAKGRVSAIQIAMDRTVEEQLLARYRWFAAGTLAISLLVCAAAGYALARRGLRPLRDITQMAQRVRSSTLNERLDRTALPVELAVLAGTFNEMLDRLEDSFRRLERFSADIAHELRTPVNNLRGEVEVALGQPRAAEDYREVLASSLEEFGRLTNLIDSLLFLARADSPQTQIAKQRLQIGSELETVRDFYEAAAHEAGVRLLVQAQDGVVAEVDRTLFQRAVGNLIANALAHTQPGGAVTLSAARKNGSILVEVTDTGCGIAPDHLPHVFDRFYRADPARNSASGSVGLGLALVKTITALHNGSCIITSERGRGTCVRMLFPAAGEGEAGDAKTASPETPRSS
jgi:two-component system heavy metal sensor histidine kinase CusS